MNGSMTETGKSSFVQKAREILKVDGVGAPGWLRWWSKQLLISGLCLSLMPGVEIT